MSDIKIKTETNKLTEYVSNEVSFGKVLQDRAAGVINDFTAVGGERVLEEGTTTGLPTYTATDAKDGRIGVHVYKFIPSLGGLKGAERLQLAVKELFSDVVGNAYASIDVSEADLIKLQLWSESLLILVLEIDRALYVYNKIDPINKLTGVMLLESLGFSYNDLSVNKQAYIDARNQLANLINNNLYLAHNGRIDKIMYLIGRVFTGDISRKTDMAVFVPVTYTVDDSTEFNLKLDWGAWETYDGDDGIKSITLDYIQDKVDKITTLVLSSWFNEVAPYLFHVYGDNRKNLMTIAPYKDVSEFAFTYNPYVNEAIRNGKLVGQIRGDSDGLLRCMIYEDDDGMIRQGGELTASGDRIFRMTADVQDTPTGSGSNYYRNIIHTGNIIVNCEDYHSDDDVLQSILALNYISRAYFDGDGYDAQDTIVEYSGPIYILSHTMNFITNEGKTQASNGSLQLVPQYVWLNNASVTTRSLTAFNSRTDTCDTPNEVIAQICGVKADWYKSQLSMIRYFIVYQSLTPGKAVYADFKDIDNTFVIPADATRNFYYSSTYALAKVDAPNWSKSRTK